MFSPSETTNPALSGSNGRLTNPFLCVGLSFGCSFDVIAEFSAAEAAKEAATAVIDISSAIASANAAAIDGAFSSIGLMLHDKERFMRPPLRFVAVLSDRRFMTLPSQSEYLLRLFPLDGTKLKGFQSPKVDKLFVARIAFQVFKAQRLPKDGKALKDVHR